MKNKLKVLIAAAEAAPFAKVGGLADVVGSLPSALFKLGVDIRLVMPKYGLIDEKKFNLKKIKSNISIPSGDKKRKINIWQSVIPKSQVKVYFIENKEFFSSHDVYPAGKNSVKRFAFFSLAALNVLSEINFVPDIIHTHDYHSAIMADLIQQSNDEKINKIKTLITIHNLEYQGKADFDTGALLVCCLKESLFQNEEINFLKRGIVSSDLINTVSPTYAREITTKQYGAGLEKTIKQNQAKLSGILNGIDVDFFNPAHDKLIKFGFTPASLIGKEKNKKFLQKQLGLEEKANLPLVGLVSRLASQKGLELITEKLIKLDCQFVFLGTGAKEYEEKLHQLAKKYPKKVSSNIGFDIKLAQQIYASSDMFLMPSRFEPCGLGQMIAMRYGSLLIARLTGGLKDTVDKSVGFGFEKFNAKALFDTLNLAITVYNKPKIWQKMVKTAMIRDFSWKKSAQEYIKLYNKLIKNSY